MYNVVAKKVHVRYLISWWVSCPIWLLLLSFLTSSFVSVFSVFFKFWYRLICPWNLHRIILRARRAYIVQCSLSVSDSRTDSMLGYHAIRELRYAGKQLTCERWIHWIAVVDAVSFLREIQNTTVTSDARTERFDTWIAPLQWNLVCWRTCKVAVTCERWITGESLFMAVYSIIRLLQRIFNCDKLESRAGNGSLTVTHDPLTHILTVTHDPLYMTHDDPCDDAIKNTQRTIAIAHSYTNYIIFSKSSDTDILYRNEVMLIWMFGVSLPLWE